MSTSENFVVCKNALGKNVYIEKITISNERHINVYTCDMPDFPVTLSQMVVREMLSALQHFAETGELPQAHGEAGKDGAE